MNIDRKTALYTKNIPCVVCIKPLEDCNGCRSFAPVYKALSEEARFRNKLLFVSMSYGQDATGKTRNLPPEYQTVLNNNGNVPLLLIHLPKDKMIIDMGNGDNKNPGGRTKENMVEAIVKALAGTEYKL